jgi:hypothetical protein
MSQSKLGMCLYCRILDIKIILLHEQRIPQSQIMPTGVFVETYQIKQKHLPQSWYLNCSKMNNFDSKARDVYSYIHEKQSKFRVGAITIV